MSRAGRFAGGLLAVFAAAAGPVESRAQSRLLFFEFQGLAGYSSAAGRAVFDSHGPMEAMQKPSLGFDLVQRFSGTAGDVAVLAVQARLAWNRENPGDVRTLEPQLYNAYLKIKGRLADVWIGHNRPKFGLSSILDSHALLLQPLSMSGFGFDRDWGIGFERLVPRGDIGLSLTTGSGMGLSLGGNHLFAARIARGVLAEDNITGGVSVGFGQILDVMGYHRMSDGSMRFAMAAADLTLLRNRFESRFELAGGGLDGRRAAGLLWRGGWNLLEEGRLKLEIQTSAASLRGTSSVQAAAGASWLLDPDWTFRSMLSYDTGRKDARIVVQLYYYKGIRL